MEFSIFSKTLTKSDCLVKFAIPCPRLSLLVEEFKQLMYQKEEVWANVEGELTMPTQGTFHVVMKTPTGQLSAKQFRKREQERMKLIERMQSKVRKCQSQLSSLISNTRQDQRIKLIRRMQSKVGKCQSQLSSLISNTRPQDQRTKLIRRMQKKVRKCQSQLSSLISNTRPQDQRTLFVELLPTDVDVENTEMKLEDSKKMSIELQKLKIEWEHSRKSQEWMDCRMQKQAKMMEEYQSQVSSLISNNKSQNQHIHSLLLELREVYKEKEELRRGNVEFKKQNEYLKNLKTQQQLVDFNFSDQVNRETGE
ncbi:uncharacterized protein LOC119980930 [Tripterygium wilfordii]|uniref:uncharacterized protein LOC119980930 n=1 Tax=Tripterygium wilfordii TaxID=458696 RepID=UPI0018F7E4F4|nr:uncharacterized protein LOC119980930 [Tripterygium wilfordii]